MKIQTIEETRVKENTIEANIVDTSSISKVVKNKNMLITGGTGSIGRAILNQVLPHEPANIIIFSRDEQKQLQMKKDYCDYSNISFRLGDTRNKDNLISACKNQDVVFHTSALKDIVSDELNPDEAIDTNTIGTRNLIAASIEQKVKRVVNISTDKAVYSTSVLGATKFLAERLIIAANKRQQDTILCNVRFGNVVGSRGSIIPVLAEQIQKNRTITITDPEMTRFMMTLDAAAKLVLGVSSISKGGETIVLKMKSTTVRKIANEIKNIVSEKTGLDIKSIKEKLIGRRESEKLHEALLSEEEMSCTFEHGDFLIIDNDNNWPNQNKNFNPKWTYSNTTEKFSDSEIYQIVLKCLTNFEKDQVPILLKKY